MNAPSEYGSIARRLLVQDNTSGHSRSARRRRRSARQIVRFTLHRYAALKLCWLLLLVASHLNAAPFAYISNSQSNDVSVIDVATNTVIATIPVGLGPQGIALSRDGTRVYVAAGESSTESTVSVIDTATNAVIATLPMASNATAIALSPDGHRAYVSLSVASQVAVVDTDSGTIIANPTVSLPVGLVVSPDGGTVYVASDSGAILVLDVASNTVTHTVPSGISPRGIAINGAGTRVYVANLASNTLSVFDTGSNAIVATLTTGTFPYGVAISPDDSRVYVTDNGSSDVSIIDTATNTVLGSIALEPFATPTGIGVSSSGTSVYVANSQANYVSVIDTACNDVSANILVGTMPVAFGIFVGAGGGTSPPPPPPLTTQVTSIELTQAIQDIGNSVPLVSGRRTFARVHVKATGAAVSGVTATLSGIGGYMSGGGEVNVPLGPIPPSNGGGPRITVQPDPHRSNIDDSFLFELPWEWTNFQGLRLAAALSEPDGPPVASCMSAIVGAPTNAFDIFTTFRVAYVRMGYELPGSFENPADAFATASIAEQLSSESWMRRTYPVSQLSFARDFQLFDPFLGAEVDQSDPFCQLEPADKRNLCAYHYVSARLAALDATSSFMDEANVAYGLIPQPSPNPTGIFTRGACCTGRAAAGPATDDTYSSHEIGHFLGRKHPVPAAAECGHTPDDPSYPYPLTLIAPQFADPDTSFAGFDGGDANLLKYMGVIPPASGFDIMGYCHPITWISDYTYRALVTPLEALHPSERASGAVKSLPHRTVPQSGDWLLVYGHISPTSAAATITTIARTDEVFNAPERAPGDYSIRLVDGGGATLADYSFAPTVESDADTPSGTGAVDLGFGYAVPYVVGTHEVRVLDNATGDTILAHAFVSANAPVVSSVAAQGSGDTLTLNWTASDADADRLHFDVYLERDGGMTLQPLQLGLSATTAQIDTSSLGGGPVQFRVVANDGVLTGYANSETSILSNRPPRPRILLPGDNVHVYLGQVINLQGEAWDPQDGDIPDSGMAWSSAQGELGTGAQLSLSTLPVGNNVITLTASDTEGLSSFQSITIFVDGDLSSPGPTLTAGPRESGWQVAVGETQTQTANIFVGNRGSGIVQFTAASDASWLTVDASSGTAPATLTIAANPTGLAGGTVLNATLTLRNAADSSQQIRIPIHLSTGDTFDVGYAGLTTEDAVFRDGFDALMP